jgi:hypothetical protein
MKRRWSLIIAGIVAAIVIPLFITSCYKDYNLDTLDYDVVVTNYDPAADFPTKNTYSMADEIVVFEDPNGPPLNVNASVQAYIFAKIEANMTALGYTKVADPANDPRDISILVAASKSDYYYYYQGCYPYYYYDYCWDYPYYGGGYYDYAFTAGSLFIQMVDTTGVAVPPPVVGAPLSAIWLSGINGIVDDYQSSSLAQQQRIEARIDQAFAQSPYLKTN